MRPSWSVRAHAAATVIGHHDHERSAREICQHTDRRVHLDQPPGGICGDIQRVREPAWSQSFRYTKINPADGPARGALGGARDVARAQTA